MKWKRSAFASGVCLLALVLGCGKTLDPPVNTDKAGEVLQSALDAWKQGEAYGDLEKRDPPIYFRDSAWEAGKKLVNYTLGKVELMGRQARCPVTMTVRDKEGNTSERKTSYQIDTTPRLVIVPENLGG